MFSYLENSQYLGTYLSYLNPFHNKIYVFTYFNIIESKVVGVLKVSG